MPAGAPTLYTPELAQRICERLIAGQSLRTICADPEMPSQPTVFQWITKHEAFAKQYARAREIQMEVMAEEILDIADDTRQDTRTITTQNGKTFEVQNAEWINRCRLQVDTRKWLMSKLAPKKYGEKIEHAGEMTIKTVLVRPDEKPADARPELRPEFDEQV